MGNTYGTRQGIPKKEHHGTGGGVRSLHSHGHVSLLLFLAVGFIAYIFSNVEFAEIETEGAADLHCFGSFQRRESTRGRACTMAYPMKIGLYSGINMSSIGRTGPLRAVRLTFGLLPYLLWLFPSAVLGRLVDKSLHGPVVFRISM